MNRNRNAALVFTPILLALLLSGLFAGPSSEPALAGKKSRSLPKAKIVVTSQKAIVNRSVLKVRITAKHRGRIKVRGFSSTFEGFGKFETFTKRKRPKFNRGGRSRVIKLRIGGAKRKLAESCEARLIQVRAGTSRSVVKSMVRDRKGCAPEPIDLSRVDRCNFIAEPDPVNCMNPFPDNYYTIGDESTGTGRRIDFKPGAMPVNAEGKRIDPAPYIESDGFSPGQTIVVRAPQLDNPAAMAQTAPAGLADPTAYLDPEAPVLVQNAKTGERVPIWVELDSGAGSPGRTSLLIHPMVNFELGTRYIVALQNLRNSGGSPIPAPAGFRYFRDSLPSGETAINMRRSRYEDIFRRLRGQGIPRSGLYLAWDFKVASAGNNTGPALSIRNRAFAELGDPDLSDRTVEPGSSAPPFVVDDAGITPSGETPRLVSGHFTVPCFLEKAGPGDDCAPGGRFTQNQAGEPVRTGTWQANFECIVPESVGASPAAPPGRALLYGHDLMGSAGGEIDGQAQRDLANGHGFVICGTDQIGMSSADLPTMTAALEDISGFPAIADRTQQGLLDQLYLARLMIHPGGLVSDPAFRVDGLPGGEPVIDTSTDRAYFRGFGQGAILGGALTALAPDFDRAVLGAGAVNFSVLLDRSTARDDFASVFYPAYPDPGVRPLALGLAQMLWDRAEGNGYAERIAGKPLADTPDHEVLIETAFGDHLVSNWQANVLARTVGARAVAPWLDPGRWPGIDGQWGIGSIGGYPFDGSAIAYFDSGQLRADPDNPGQLLGTYPPPVGNEPPDAGVDPHGDPGLTEAGQQMASAFLQPGGKVIDACGAGPCYAGGYDGP